MKNFLSPNAWLRTWLAAVVALVFIVILLPRSGRLVLEPVTGFYVIEDQLKQMVTFAALMLFPVALVYWGGKLNWKLEVIGWVLLISLFSVAIAKTSGRPIDKAYKPLQQELIKEALEVTSSPAGR